MGYFWYNLFYQLELNSYCADILKITNQTSKYNGLSDNILEDDDGKLFMAFVYALVLSATPSVFNSY